VGLENKNQQEQLTMTDPSTDLYEGELYDCIDWSDRDDGEFNETEEEAMLLEFGFLDEDLVEYAD